MHFDYSMMEESQYMAAKFGHAIHTEQLRVDDYVDTQEQFHVVKADHTNLKRAADEMEAQQRRDARDGIEDLEASHGGLDDILGSSSDEDEDEDEHEHDNEGGNGDSEGGDDGNEDENEDDNKDNHTEDDNHDGNHSDNHGDNANCNSPGKKSVSHQGNLWVGGTTVQATRVDEPTAAQRLGTMQGLPAGARSVQPRSLGLAEEAFLEKLLAENNPNNRSGRGQMQTFGYDNQRLMELWNAEFLQQHKCVVARTRRQTDIGACPSAPVMGAMLTVRSVPCDVPC